MREIKFRVWDKVNKWWINFNSCKNGIEYCQDQFRVSSGYDSYDSPTYEEDYGDRMAIMQFTGLKDKNGVEIYEGDIIKWDENEWGSLYMEKVEWDYTLLDSRKNDWAQFCEVIGNIYENSDILTD